MPLRLSVLTPVPAEQFRPPGWDDARGLAVAYASLCQLPCEWEWLIMGPEAVFSVEDPRVRWISAPQNTAAALNLGLLEATAPYVVVLDNASQLLPGVVTLCDALDHALDAAYAFGNAVDYEYEAGVEVRAPMQYPYGKVPIGDVLQYWENHHAWWFAPQSAIWRRAQLLALGGWPALPASIHTSLLIRASAVAPALAVDCEPYRYTRFGASPPRNGEQSTHARAAYRFLHAQIEQARSHGYLPRFER
jgi:hypothetical protein